MDEDLAQGHLSLLLELGYVDEVGFFDRLLSVDDKATAFFGTNSGIVAKLVVVCAHRWALLFVCYFFAIIKWKCTVCSVM